MSGEYTINTEPIFDERSPMQPTMESSLAMGDLSQGQEMMTPRELKDHGTESVVTSAQISPRATPNSACTHNNIFGEPPPSPRREGKIFHMSSDIFGVGSIVDRTGNHMSARPDGRTASSSFADKIGADVDAIARSQGSSSMLAPGSDRKPNARENGCNPVTGHGYAEGDSGKTQRRQYPQRRTQSLW